ncbi:MAG: hypothetical protein C5B50_08855 [Verrucomicrobia bacterium]|nr:MAG: hypothetical protein C5B50_08855 [Verrucomicrobiota bacterium]
MIGPILNAAAILVGGAVGLTRKRPFSAANESFFKVALGVFAIWFGLRLTWISLQGPVGHQMVQLLIAVLALMLGKLFGRFVRLQELSNRLGRSARQNISEAAQNDPRRLEKGFKTCAALFCAAPLGILGAIQDGLSDYYQPLAVKSVMDGLATFGFARMFGPGVGLAALPVFALQGTISLSCSRILKPFLDLHHLTDPTNVAGGLLVFAVGLVILELKKIELAAYLPSLVFAPLIAWLFASKGS